MDARMRRVGADDDLRRLASRPTTPLPLQRALVQMGALRSRSGRAMEQRAGNTAWRFRAQGAAMAIEDACVLSAPIARYAEDLDKALLAYERVRVPGARAAVLGSRERARENHLASPWARLKPAC